MPQQYNGFTPDITQNYSGFTPDDEKPKDKSFGSGYGRPHLRDIALTAAKIPSGLGEALMGLSDIATTPYRMGLKALGFDYKAPSAVMQEKLGYDPKMLNDWIEEFESPELQTARKEMGQNTGIADTASSLWRNPGVGALGLEESIPYMYGGSGIARIASNVVPKLGRLGAAALGEGTVGAGLQASQIRQDTGDVTPLQALIAAGSGGLTGLTTLAGGKLANYLGIPDIDQLLADPSLKWTKKILPYIGGMFGEAGEEGIQSPQERTSLNLAEDKPIGQGIGPAATMGAVTGFGMGGMTALRGAGRGLFGSGAPKPGTTAESGLPAGLFQHQQELPFGPHETQLDLPFGPDPQQYGPDRPPIGPTPGIDPFTGKFRKIPTEEPTQQGFEFSGIANPPPETLFDMSPVQEPVQTPPVDEGIKVDIAGPPNVVPEGSTLSDDQQTVTITHPSKELISYWRSKGYEFPPPGQRLPGPLRMSKSQSQTTAPPPPPSGGSIAVGEPIPTKNVNPRLLQALEKMGWVVDTADAVWTSFKRSGGNQKGEVDFTVLAQRLRERFGREPSRQEVEQEAFKLKADTPPPMGETGLVAPFDSGFQVDETHPANNMPPVDPAQLQAFRDSFGDRLPVDEWPVNTTIVNDPQTLLTRERVVQDYENLKRALENPNRGVPVTPHDLEILERYRRRIDNFPPETPTSFIPSGMREITPQNNNPAGLDPRMAARIESVGPTGPWDLSRRARPEQGMFPMEMREQNQLANIADADLNRRQAQSEADLLARTPLTEPSQESMIPQMQDEEIRRYLMGEDATPPEMRDLSEYGPIDDEPRFEQAEHPYNPRHGEAYRHGSLQNALKEGSIADLNRWKNILTQELQNFEKEAGKNYPRNLSGQAKRRVIFTQRKIAKVDAEIASRGPQQTDLFDDEPRFASVKGGGYKGSMNTKRGIVNITSDYTSKLEIIMPREGMQNAMDAAEKLGVDGEVRVRLNSSEQSIEIADNGNGMDHVTLADKLFEAFSTGKEDEEGATGGKGIGSASYIYGGKYFTVDTVAVDVNNNFNEDGSPDHVADGLKHRIVASGTPAEFLQGTSNKVDDIVPDDTPTGTTIRIVLKDDQDFSDARRSINNIIEHSRNRESTIRIDPYAATSNDELKDADVNSGFFGENKIKPSSGDKQIGDFTTQHRNSDVKVLIPPYTPQLNSAGGPAKTPYVNIHYLNNGMYQFTKELYLGDAEGAPPDVLVDVHPLVDDQNPLYPFINTREDVKGDIRDEVDKFITENIKGPAVERRKNRIQELYDSMIFLPNMGTYRKAVIFDPGNRLTQHETEMLQKDPVVRELIQLYDRELVNILDAVGRQNWIDRVEGIGIVMDPNVHGIHIPNPSTGKSTILFNPFIRIGSLDAKSAAWGGTITQLHEVAHVGSEGGLPTMPRWSVADKVDPRFPDFLTEFFDQIHTHGDVGYRQTGHGIDFAHRLGEVYAQYGIENTWRTAAELQAIYEGPKSKSGWQLGQSQWTGSSRPYSGYSPEIQRLLQLYQDSRGRPAVTEDLLSGTGVKQANRGRGGAGRVPRNSGPNGKGTAAQQTSWLKEALAIPKNATTMGDLSAPGRQGLALIHTPEFWKAFFKMFGALHYDTFKMMDDKLRAKSFMRDHVDLNTGKVIPSLASQIGTKLFTPASEFGPRAEATASKWLEVGVGNDPLSKLWKNTAGYPIRATNRAFILFLNDLNVNRTEKLLNLSRDIAIKAETTGRARMPGLLGTGGLITKAYTKSEAEELDPYRNLVLAREIAEFVNVATGHGAPKNWVEKKINAIGDILFSPGLLISRMRMMNPGTYIMASPFVRRQYLKSALSVAAAWFIMTQLMKNALGDEAEISDDPLSADFGKVRIGNARLDLAGGFQQFAVAYARLFAGGKTSSASQQFQRFGSGYQAETQRDNMQRFLVNKLDPTAKFAWDIASASEYNPFHVGDRILQMFTPLLIQDLYEINKKNPELLGPFGAAALFGGGTQIYEKGESISKFIDQENDWNVTGGGLRDLMPWNWNDEAPRNFPWSTPE